MRCAASEAAFEALLDGTLSARERSAVDAHVATCSRCSSVLEELRVVDALLLEPRRLEPAFNFTFATMAEIRSMPAPQVARSPLPLALGAYLVLAWIAIAGWLVLAGPNARAAFAMGNAYVARILAAFGGIAHGASASLSRDGGSAIAFGVGAVLLADIAAIGAIVYVRNVVSPRLAARLERNSLT